MDPRSASPKLTCLSHAEIEAVLKQAGINPTAQRIAIGRFVLCEAEHPTAEAIKQWVDQHFPKMSLATVYNTLKILVEAGLVRELKLPHTDCVMYDTNLRVHYHFLDERTGELLDIPCEEVDLTPKLGPGFAINAVEVLLRGTRT